MNNKLKAVALAIVLALAMIKGFESKSNYAYLDPVMIATICYGDTKNVKLGDYASDPECEKRLDTRVTETNRVIDKYVKVDLTAHTRAAMISFVYNIGETQFHHSTLLRKLNSGDTVGACHELPKWNHAKGKVLRGLTTRRAREMSVCLQED